MRLGLRGRILILAVVTPLTLGLATYVTVHRNVTEHVNSSSIHESLVHSARVFESTLHSRERTLGGGARVVVQDPRFFSLLMLGVSQRDTRFLATVRGMAADFNRITQTDVFEVLDPHGQLLASVGSAPSSPQARAAFVRSALGGSQVEGILVERNAHFQIAATPILADHRVVGVLLLGTRIGDELARDLRSQMLSEVTFLSGRTVTGTTLKGPGDRDALLKTLSSLAIRPGADLRPIGVIQVHGPQRDYLTLVRRIPGSDPQTNQLYVMQRSFDPETSFLHVMQRDMFRLAVMAVVAALLSGWLFSNQILKPLQDLVRGAQEMEAGNYEHPLSVRRRDEIGYLAQRFVEMRRREHAYVGSLEQAARLKNEFINIASHELRTPISVLEGYRELFAAGQLGPLTPKQAEVLAAMGEYLVRLTRVADDAARIAEVNSERLQLDFHPLEIASLVRRAVALAVAEDAKRTVEVVLDCAAVGEKFEADMGGMQQAVMNLVTNGIRFTPDDGRVDVRVRLEGDRVRIEVADNGVGIPEDRLGPLFSHGMPVRESLPHQSSNGLAFNSAGLGLGLSIARAIVEAHAGSLTARSVPGEGSTFTVDMPIAQGGEGRLAA